MKKLKVLLSVMAMSFIMIGCGGGGGGSSLPSVDNSVLADDSNAYGYIGDSVVFGGIEVTGGWDLWNTVEGLDHLYGSFNSDGTGYLSVKSSTARTDFVYGVSQDGRVINTSETIKLTITGVLEDGVEFWNNGELVAVYDCYYVDYEDWIGEASFHMCPSSVRL